MVITRQLGFFDNGTGQPALAGLEGFRYQPDLIGPSEEAALLTHVRKLPFREFEFHGYLGKRRVVSFGWKYDYSSRSIQEADRIPAFLLPLRSLAASFAEMDPHEFQQALVTEYRPATGIGWHRDKAVFGKVVGISLLSQCVLRFRRRLTGKRSSEAERARQRAKEWERINISTDPRSAYLLSGPARSEWEHSILSVGGLRYSITFRNVRDHRQKSDQHDR